MKYDIKKLTIEEKIALLVGADCWAISNANGKLPTVVMNDGPHGLRKPNPTTGETIKATAMPTLSALSCSWNPELSYLDGQTIADDCIEYQTDILLAPGVNIKRTPLCGRNFEYFSEDPYLAGIMGKAYIEGVQSKGVGTSLKHFLANNREYDRLSQTSEVDERTLREIYLPAFEIALQAKPWTVMCSYNPINGIYASENEYFLNDVLRKELGFDGVIVSDWGATHNPCRAAKATLDITMPYKKWQIETLTKAYEKGWLTEAEIDARVEKILQLIEKATTADKKLALTKEQRHENAVTIAKECFVLLKNEGNLLPLKQGKIAVCGSYANTPPMGGDGSSLVQTAYVQPPLAELLQNRLGNKAMVNFAYRFKSLTREIVNVNEVYKAAYSSDVTLLCVGTDKIIESEGYDRESIRLPLQQEDIIINAAKQTDNLVVLLYAGSAVDMSAWIDKVKAVVLVGFAGEGVNEALADVLTGKVSPSGKLTETYPLCLSDTPSADYCGNGQVERYSEGVFVGYRWFDSMQKEVLFPFGFGLSYAKFEYSDLQVKKCSETDYEVSYVIKNVSNVDAKEISQVYVRDPIAMVSRPEKELKAFSKDLIKAGESKRVCVKLNSRAFAYYNVCKKAWTIENGWFEILVGASSRDIKLKAKIEICLPEEQQHTLN